MNKRNRSTISPRGRGGFFKVDPKWRGGGGGGPRRAGAAFQEEASVLL